jgi:hypothetical protein
MQPSDDRMPQGGPSAGDPVRVRYTKWGGGPHWEWDATVLDVDEHGVWMHMPEGTHMSRPGMSVREKVAWVALAPHDAPWLAGFYPAAKVVTVYVDMATVPRWNRLPEGTWEVATVDLDLDVILTREGHLFVDDEDEFELHQVELGYPSEVIELARRSCDWVHAAIAGGVEPFGHAGLLRVEQVAGPGATRAASS